MGLIRGVALIISGKTARYEGGWGGEDREQRGVEQ